MKVEYLLTIDTNSEMEMEPETSSTWMMSPDLSFRSRSTISESGTPPVKTSDHFFDAS